MAGSEHRSGIVALETSVVGRGWWGEKRNGTEKESINNYGVLPLLSNLALKLEQISIVHTFAL